MKKILFVSILLITTLFLTSGAAATANFANLNVTTVKYDPYPAEPGKYVQVWIKIQNYATEQADDVVIELLPSYPFYLDTGENSTRSFGKISSFQDLLVNYKVRVDEKAVEGWSDLKVRLSSSTGSKEFTMRIFVRTTEAVVTVESVASEPKEIAPGASGKVTITIKNTANSVLKDISVKLDISSADVPFSPIGSATEKKLYILNSLEEKSVVFDVIADASAEAKTYKIPLRITYHDEVGTNYTKSDTVSLLIGAQPELLTDIESSTILAAGENGSVNINIVNKGLIKIKFLTVNLGGSDNYQILSSNYVYIGELKSDDYQSAKFDIFVRKDAKNVSLPVTLTYRDNNNNPYSEAKSLKLVLYTPDQLNAMGVRSSGASSNIIIAVVAIAAAYFLYKRFRKK